MLNILQYIKNNRLSVIVKPNQPKLEVIKYDKERGALRVALTAVPEKGKANQELIRFLSKLTKRECRLVSGSKSPKKTLEFI